MLRSVLFLAALVAVATAGNTTPQHSEAFKATVSVFEGTLEGFFAGSHFTDIKNCANDTVDTFEDIKSAVSLLEKKVRCPPIVPCPAA
jgi:hypothetical protein